MKFRPIDPIFPGEAAGELPTLFHAAVAKALAGETTFEEVLRVSPRD